MMAIGAENADPVLAAALEYAARGKPVFPCGPTKRPLTQTGFKSATTDSAIIEEWWTRWPDALIGMPTGRASGIVAIDLDVREGYDGADALAQMESAYSKLPETIESLTAGGGRHLLFEWPGFEVKNSASKLGLGIDVRGDGGYIIVPPSVLPDGRRYEWEASNPDAPAKLPVWAMRLLGATVRPQGVKEDAGTDGATAGQRNVYLASIAGRLAHAGLARDQIRGMIKAENARACSPPLSADEIERTVMKSATKWVLKAEAEGDKAPDDPSQARMFPWVAADRWVEDMRAPDWLIAGHIERGTLNVNVGGWGSGKSAIELDRDLRLAHGMRWQGIACTPCLVVYVVGEAQRGFQRRVAAWHQYHEIEPTDRFIVIPEAVLLGQPDHEAALAATLDDIQRHYGEAISKVTLDTMARCFGLDDESSNSDVSRWVNSISAFIIEPTGAAVSVLHHPGHGAKDRGRGASALPGAADTEWLIEREGNAVVMRCNKSKDSEFPPPVAWRLLGVALEIDGQAVTAPVVEEAEAPDESGPPVKVGSKQAQALGLLQTMYREARDTLEAAGRGAHHAVVERQDWRERLEAEGVISKANPRQAFNRLVNELAEKGAVINDPPHVYPARPVKDFG